MLALFRALPPYLGGKRRLIPHIFRHVPPPAEAPVFVDAFMGGGSVSLYAKARGYQVLANDIADRCAIVGRALIENDHVRPTEADLLRLTVERPEARGLIAAEYCPKYYTRRHAIWLDRMGANLADMEPGTKRDLLALVWWKALLRPRPFSQHTDTTVHAALEDGDLEGAPKSKLKSLRDATEPAWSMVRVAAREVAQGVFSNGRRNRFFQLDVLDFVRSVQGDVLYLDPPYAGSESYERHHKVLDHLLEHYLGAARPNAVSRFTSGGLEALADVLRAADHFPLWIISCGAAKIPASEWLAMVQGFRPTAVRVPLRMSWSIAVRDGRSYDASDKDILIVARRP